MKICKDCKIEKELRFFNKSGKWYRGRCKSCHNKLFQPATGKPNVGRFKKGSTPIAGFKKGQMPWNKGRPWTAEERERIGIKKRIGINRKSWKDNEWKKKCLERDNFTCKECFTTSYLVVHHIKGFHEYPELRFDIGNGITLCRSCHGKLHGKEMCNVYNGKLFKKGHIPWNKGKKLSEDHIQKLSESHKGQIPWNTKAIEN